MADKVTVPRLVEMKAKGEKIAMLTAYDFSTAQALDQAGVDIALIGDSLAMVVLGHENTLSVTMEDMLHHVKPVARACKRAMVVADMPFLSYQISVEDGMRNAGRFIQEGGAQAVKLEGGEGVAELTARLVKMGIPVMGHLGLTPQSVHAFGGHKLQASDVAAAKRLIHDAKLLEEAGAFSIVLEKIPVEVAKVVSESLTVPTIGIGAGVDCDGQVLVTNDLLGQFEKFVPKFTKQYAHIARDTRNAFTQYVKEVKAGTFPGREHSYFAGDAVAKALKGRRS